MDTSTEVTSVDSAWLSVRRALRITGIAALLLAIMAAGAYAYFLSYPAPEPPRLSTAVHGDSLGVSGLMRSYLAFVPARLAERPALVIALHAAMGNARQMREATGYRFERLADAHGFIVVYPNGYERHWNDCRRKAPYAAKLRNVDDVGFIRALITQFRDSHGVDTSRVFVVGYSNGAHLAYRLALETPEIPRAVAAIAANLPTDDNLDCTSVAGTTPAMIINGTHDRVNPYDGGRVTLFGFGDRGDVRSARATAEYFATRNGASVAPIVNTVPETEALTTSAERALWWSDTGEVVLYTIRRGGHTIPQPGGRFPRLLGRTHPALDAPGEIWRFFERHGASR